MAHNFEYKFLLTLCLTAGLGCASEEISAGKPEPASVDRIPYQEIRRWEIPNGGFGRTIVIDPTLANEFDLRRLGAQLRDESHNDKNSFVFVYDSERAARMQGGADLASEDSDYYMRHTIGRYTRNGNTGYHQFSMTPEGILGPAYEALY